MAKLGKRTVFMALGLVVGSVVVFVAATAGLLAAKGKLNKQGLSAFHGLPVVGELFPKPEPLQPRPALAEGEGEPSDDSGRPGAIKALSSGEIRRLMREARRLRDELKAKREALATHERRLESLENDLARKRTEIEAIKQAVEKGWQELQQARAELEKDKVIFRESERKNLTRMAKVYEAMPPEKAVETMGGVDEDTVVKLLFLMVERAAGKILAGFDPQKAAQITEKMRRMRERADTKTPGSKS